MFCFLLIECDCWRHAPEKKMCPWIMELLSDYINKWQIFLAVTLRPLISVCWTQPRLHASVETVLFSSYSISDHTVSKSNVDHFKRIKCVQSWSPRAFQHTFSADSLLVTKLQSTLTQQTPRFKPTTFSEISSRSSLVLKVVMVKVGRLFLSGLPEGPAGGFIVVYWRGRLDGAEAVLLLPQRSRGQPRASIL